MLFDGPGVGKTRLAMEMAEYVAQGLPLLHRALESYERIGMPRHVRDDSEAPRPGCKSVGAGFRIKGALLRTGSTRFECASQPGHRVQGILDSLKYMRGDDP